jgi:hypothetical protein
VPGFGAAALRERRRTGEAEYRKREQQPIQTDFHVSSSIEWSGRLKTLSGVAVYFNGIQPDPTTKWDESVSNFLPAASRQKNVTGGRKGCRCG